MSYQKKCKQCDSLAIQDGLCPSHYRIEHGMKKPEPSKERVRKFSEIIAQPDSRENYFIL